jgi:hypothetical protein
MRMKKGRGLTVLVVALAVGASLYALSPWWALAGLAQAVEKGDRYGMQRYIDFPRVRESVSAQADAYLAKKAGSDEVAGAVGAMIGSVVVNRAVENAVSPDGLARLLAISREARRDGGSGGGDGKKVESRPKAARSLHERLDLDWVGLSSVRVTSFNRKGKLLTTGYLERQGLTWRVVDIEVPALRTDSARDGADPADPSGVGPR